MSVSVSFPGNTSMRVLVSEIEWCNILGAVWQVVGVRTGDVQTLKSAVADLSSCFSADLCCFSGCLLTLTTQGKEYIDLDSQVKRFSFLFLFELPGAGPMLVGARGAVEECSFVC